jgi:hypothetical protein
LRAVIRPAALFGYSPGGAVLTLVLPLGLFIVIMIAMYFVFGRRNPVPGRRTVAGAKPAAAEPQAPADDDDTAVSDTAISDTAAGDVSADEPAGEGKQADPE